MTTLRIRSACAVIVSGLLAILALLTSPAAYAQTKAVLLDAPQKDYAWHEESVRALGYTVTRYDPSQGQSGLVLRMVGKLTNAPLPDGRYGAYSVAIDLSYRCAVGGDLTGMVSVRTDPIVVGTYPFILTRGELDYDQIRRIEKETLTSALEQSGAARTNPALCASFADMRNLGAPAPAKATPKPSAKLKQK